MQSNPYLMFEGRCEEALDFYKSALGAEVGMMMRYEDGPSDTQTPPGAGKKIMHAEFKLGDSTLMCSDGMCSGQTSFAGISLTLATRDKGEAEKLYEALSAGGAVQMPLTETFFSPAFGMVSDKFGVSWMVMAEPEGEG